MYRDALEALPFTVVGNRPKEVKSKVEAQLPPVVRGYIADQVQPAVTREDAATDKSAGNLLWARACRPILEPTSSATIAVLRQVIAANTAAKPDIWPAREMTLSARARATPVSVAIWDSCVDTSLFPDRLFEPTTQGAGDNGHSISFDVCSRPTTGVLRPLTSAQRGEYTSMMADFQGISDSRAAIDSPAAERLRAKPARMTMAESAAYAQRLVWSSRAFPIHHP